MEVIERKRQEREIRRELAIDAAMGIYEEEGYHSITMEKIAERSKLSRAALYLYFRNKEEILISAIVAHADYLAGSLKELYNNRENTKGDLLEKLWTCFQESYEKDPVTFTAWEYFHQSDVVDSLSPELRDILHRSASKVVGLQLKIVEYAVRERMFIECDPRVLSEVVWSTFLGIVYVERSKIMLSHKSHMISTQDIAKRMLARGVANLSRQREGNTAGGMCDDEVGAQQNGL